MTKLKMNFESVYTSFVQILYKRDVRGLKSPRYSLLITNKFIARKKQEQDKVKFCREILMYDYSNMEFTIVS